MPTIFERSFAKVLLLLLGTTSSTFKSNPSICVLSSSTYSCFACGVVTLSGKPSLCNFIHAKEV